jgi:hypothetical protein
LQPCPRGTGAARFNARVGLDLDESPRQRAEREAVERAAAGSPLRGQPLPERPRLERTTLERYLRAAAGPLLYMRRLREIDEAMRRHEQALAERLADLTEATRPAALAAAWRSEAERWNLSDVNRLIEQHNRWYPVEAQLPMDPRTGDYALVGGRPYIRPLLDASWILERFPVPVQTL